MLDYHLGLCLSGGLSLGGHGPLQLLGQPHVLDLHTLDPDAPVVRGGVQGAQHRLGDVLPVRQNVLDRNVGAKIKIK